MTKMKKRLRFLTLALALLAGTPLFAQEHELTADEKLESAAYRAMMEAQDSSLYILESLEENDESDYSWAERYFIHTDPNCVRDLNPQPVPDSIYIMRLRALPTIIEMPFNQPVKKALDFYLMRRRALVERMVSVGFNYYFPIFEDALQKYELPSELKYLACIESALRQNAYSPARAAGLWQFIPASGMMQGLEVNSYIDERYDLYKSTEAACRFLKKLYNKFGDWHLAIAAYNCGPGNIDKAIARSGGHRTFWQIYNYLPQETRAYVPFFIAATYVMTYHCEHGLCGSETDIPFARDTIMVDHMVHFEQISHCLDLPMEVIESLNPQYVRDIVPGSPEKHYSLTLPTTMAIAFLMKQDSIYSYKAETLLPRNGRVTEIVTRGRNNEYVRQGGNRGSSANHKAGTGRIYTVRKGESLGSIARKHHTTTAKLRSLNKLRSDRIHPGQKLRLP